MVDFLRFFCATKWSGRIYGGERVNQSDDVNKHVLNIDIQNIANFCLSLSKDMLSSLAILYEEVKNRGHLPWSNHAF